MHFLLNLILTTLKWTYKIRYVSKLRKEKQALSFWFQASNFKHIESIDDFLSSQERQSIIFHLLNGIRAEKGDAATEKLKFRDGEAICKQLVTFIHV